MDDSSAVERLSEAIGYATRSAHFCVADCLAAVDPGIIVEGLGAVTLPLKRGVAKALIASCQVAPYGEGAQTLVNKEVRNTFELDPVMFRLGDAWNAAIDNAMGPVAEELGLPAEELEARLYKLLVYDKGGFFLPHRDSEKYDRMVASMIVVLPNPFEGGTLVVRHGTATQRLTFQEAAAGKAPCYAAFYADCEHEVKRVTGGVRLCLAYNLVLKPNRAKKSAAAIPTTPVGVLGESIRSWIAKQPAKPLVFALEHHYTERGLSLDLLKGADRQLADLVVNAAEKTDCIARLAQVSRHLSQFADDGSFGGGHSRYGRAPRRAIEIGETYEDDLTATQWTNVNGQKQPLGDIALDLAAIVSAVPIDDWTPTSEEFEGYTGNAGNTLDRWYHRSAIIVWHRENHFEIVASSGATDSIPLFCSMATKLAKTPKKRLEGARVDCIRFARAIIAGWPRRTTGYGRHESSEKSPYDDFPEHLLMLHDRDTIALILTKLVECDDVLQLNSFVLAAFREFGSNALAQELKRILSTRPDGPGQHEIPLRDAEWLAAICCDKTLDADKSAVVEELCNLAVDRFCKSAQQQPTYRAHYYRREASVSESSLPFLLKALLASGHEDGLARVINFVRESPEDFSLDDCQVPTLKTLVPWSRKQRGLVHPQVASWLASVRQKLESATARHPAPPTDWARPADLTCQCQCCAQLKAFLADPANEVGRIAAREDLRRHVIGIIDRQQCDVKHALERKKSPYSLVLTKTMGSYDRAVNRFEADQQLLSDLPVEE